MTICYNLMMPLGERTVSGRNIWDGSKPVPLHGSGEVRPDLIKIDLMGGRNTFGLDLGCGTGRSTEILARELGTKNIVALDISHVGLQEITITNKKVEASVTRLPFADGVFDWVNLTGLMTNLTDRNPKVGREMRKNAIQEAVRVLRVGGVLLISDFARTHYLSRYRDNYKQHALITDELGTLAIFDSEEHSPFNGISLTDEEVKGYKDSPYLVRYARHFLPNELRRLVEEAGCWIDSLTLQMGKRPSGRTIDQVIIPGIKGYVPKEIDYQGMYRAILEEFGKR